VTAVDDTARKALLRRGFALEYATLGWSVAGIVVLALAAVAARSVALAGFGLDSPYAFRSPETAIAEFLMRPLSAPPLTRS
jgi:predicted lysophospholipase L1 biosynthesis ABC-type transport system permease subunit